MMWRFADKLRRVSSPPAVIPATTAHAQLEAAATADSPVSLAAIQPPIELYALEPQAQRAEANANAMRLLAQAAQQKAALALLPERFPMRGVKANRQQVWEWANVEGDSLFEQLAQFAGDNNMAIIAPVGERREDRLYNAAWVFDRQGKFVGRYAKVHCTQTERDLGLTPGNEWPVFDLGFVRVGVLICHDMSFPESARCLMLNGADVLVWPHNQGGWGDVAWEAIIRSRAIDNGFYLVAACCGTPANRGWRPGALVGMSGVMGPDGTWLACMGRGVGVAAAVVDINQPRYVHDFSEPGAADFRAAMRADRRVDTYETLLQR